MNTPIQTILLTFFFFFLHKNVLENVLSSVTLATCFIKVSIKLYRLQCNDSKMLYLPTYPYLHEYGHKTFFKGKTNRFFWVGPIQIILWLGGKEFSLHQERCLMVPTGIYYRVPYLYGMLIIINFDMSVTPSSDYRLAELITRPTGISNSSLYLINYCNFDHFTC